MARLPAKSQKLKVVSRLGMRQQPTGRKFVHAAGHVGECTHANATTGKEATAVAARVTCPTCRIKMIKIGTAKAVPEFGAREGNKIYL